jgi:hypothetical protein
MPGVRPRALCTVDSSLPLSHIPSPRFVIGMERNGPELKTTELEVGSIFKVVVG